MSGNIVSGDSKIVRSFAVRKRKTGGRTFLILLTALFEIDRFSESLWDLCSAPVRFDQLLTAMAGAFPDLPAEGLIKLVAHNVVVLVDAGFLRVDALYP